MSVLDKVTVNWAGFPGAPGVSTFYFSSYAAANASALNAWITALKPYVPLSINLDVADSGMKIDSGTGATVGTWSEAGGTPTTMSGTNSYSSVSGAVINWLTGQFIGGRQLRGKTFIVPLSTSHYDPDGTISSGCVTALTNASNTLRGVGANMRVYSRRNSADALISGVFVPDKAVVLRSRRQ